MIAVVWDNSAQTIIRLDYFEPIASWHEYRAAIHQAHEMARSVAYDICIVHNAGSVKMPSEGTQEALEELAKTINDVPESVGILISITTGNLEKRITRVATQISLKAEHLPIYMVNSLETAYELIHAYVSGNNIELMA